MKLFSYRWSDECVSLVYAESLSDAYRILDELGEVETKRIAPLKSRNFFVTFKATGHPVGDNDPEVVAWTLDDEQGEGFEFFLEGMRAKRDETDEDAS